MLRILDAVFYVFHAIVLRLAASWIHSLIAECLHSDIRLWLTRITFVHRDRTCCLQNDVLESHQNVLIPEAMGSLCAELCTCEQCTLADVCSSNNDFNSQVFM